MFVVILQLGVRTMYQPFIEVSSLPIKETRYNGWISKEEEEVSFALKSEYRHRLPKNYN